MHPIHRLYSYLLLLFVLSACSGIPAPQNLQQGIAYGYTTVATVRTTAASLLQAKKINVAEARNVQALADQARAALDIAAEASKADKPVDAQSALNLANQVLGNLQSYLQQKGG